MYFLVPHDVSDQSATLWIGALDEPPNSSATLQPEPSFALAYGQWKTWPAERPRIRFQLATATGLSPRQRYYFSLLRDGEAVAQANVSTLPETLPVLGEKPFTILLGSCFSCLEDKDAKVGNAFFHMPHPARPDIKIFAGDQVYLDSPWHRFLMNTHTPAELQEIFLDHYVQTWAQSEGFARLLAHGANYFSSDDHEYWNNAPNRAAYVQDTWPGTGNREVWWNTARELYRVFQTDRTITEFKVPPVSFLIADTRINRSMDRSDFMRPGDLDMVREWVAHLPGPGILVIGQPLLQAATGFFKGHLGDWNLPDYEQYGELADIVAGSAQSLLILSGDVHYGRIARASLSSGAELIEIISSPLSLVDEKAKGVWEKAPPMFPAVLPSVATRASLGRSGVVTEEGFSSNDSHFLTLEFTRRGGGAHFRLRYWPIFREGVPPPNFGETILEQVLEQGMRS